MRSAKSAERRRALPALAALLPLAVAALLAASGCVERDRDVFFHGTNFADKETIVATLDLFRDGVNARDADRLMRAFPEKFRYPDELDPTRIHTYDTMRREWRTFFERATGIDYRYGDLFLRIDEANAQAELSFTRRYRGHAPFLHDVNDTATERVILRKDQSGGWTIAALGARLFPPTVHDK